jgi:hypothetical protein
MPNKPESTDRDAFLASLALFDRDDRDLRQRALPGDTDIDAAVDAAFARLQRNPTLLPL